MPTIAALGDVDIDLIMDVGDYPRPGDEVFADTSHSRLGGSAVNTAVWLARLGFPARVLAQVGADAFGRQATSSLEAAGVDTSRLAVSGDLPTGMNVLFVTPDGERTMIGLRGANRSYPGSPDWEADCEWLHLSGYAFLEGEQRGAAYAALATAREAGLGVSVDVPSGVARVLGPELVEPLSDAAMVSVGAEPLSWIVPGPDPVGELLAKGPDTVAVTAGGAPFSLVRQDESVTLEPPPVDVVDTTGAGDAFVAGLVAGRLWDLNPGPTAALAAALGATATRSQGAGNEGSDIGSVAGLLTRQAWPACEPDWLDAAHRALTSAGVA